ARHLVLMSGVSEPGDDEAPRERQTHDAERRKPAHDEDEERHPRHVQEPVDHAAECTRSMRSRRPPGRRYARASHGPWIANVIPGFWMLTNSVRPSGEKHAPAS